MLEFDAVALFSKWLSPLSGSSGILTSSQVPCNIGHFNETLKRMSPFGSNAFSKLGLRSLKGSPYTGS